MVTRDLGVVRQAEVAIRHPTEQKRVVLGEFEGFGGAIGVFDLEGDFGGHRAVIGVLRMRREIVNPGGRLAARRRYHGLRRGRRSHLGGQT